MFMRKLMITIQSDKEKKLILFDEMIADIMTNKKCQTIIKELFIRCRKLNISLVFITQSYFSVPKIKYFTCFYYSIVFFCSKRCQIKHNILFHHENK